VYIALTWRVIYIGQASDSSQDQILEEAGMDELQPGQMKFVFEVSNSDDDYLVRVTLPM
jgi:ASF1 like histone chaperone